MRKAATMFVMVAAMAATASAQDETARRVATEVAARVPLEKAVTGAPYSADTLVEGVQTLADGNRIVRKTTGRVYRDNEGRTRREEDLQVTSRTQDGSPSTTRRTSIAIVDPVAGFSYTLDAERKIAWRTSLNVTAGILSKIEGAQPAVVARRDNVETTAPDGTRTVSPRTTFVETTRAEAEKIQAEQAAAQAGARGSGGGGGGGRGGAVAGGFGAVASVARGGGGRGGAADLGPLERKTLDGLIVEGRKTTRVIPAGQVGNEQPLTVVSEEWRSVDLNVLVMTRHSDPRTGESTYRLTNVVRAEPDRSLFIVPSDYEVRETGVRRMVQQQY